MIFVSIIQVSCYWNVARGSEIKDNRRYFNIEDCDNISIILVLELKQKSFIQIMGTLYKQTPES